MTLVVSRYVDLLFVAVRNNGVVRVRDLADVTGLTNRECTNVVVGLGQDVKSWNSPLPLSVAKAAFARIERQNFLSENAPAV